MPNMTNVDIDAGYASSSHFFIKISRTMLTNEDRTIIIENTHIYLKAGILICLIQNKLV